MLVYIHIVCALNHFPPIKMLFIQDELQKQASNENL